MNPFLKPFDKGQAEKAIQYYKDLEFTKSTSGYAIMEKWIHDAEQWEFDQSISADFQREVMSNPALYAKHAGFVAGLRYVSEKMKDAERQMNKAVKDLERHGNS